MIEIRVISEGATPSVYTAYMTPQAGYHAEKNNSFQDTLQAKLEEAGGDADANANGAASSGAASLNVDENGTDAKLSAEAAGGVALSVGGVGSVDATGVSSAEEDFPSATDSSANVTLGSTLFGVSTPVIRIPAAPGTSSVGTEGSTAGSVGAVSDGRDVNGDGTVTGIPSAAGAGNSGTGAKSSSAGGSVNGAGAGISGAETSLESTGVNGTGTTGTVPYDAYFTEAANTYGVDKKLLTSVAQVESAFLPNVVSSAGAVGVMQLMPATAEAMGVNDSYDPRQNIMGGAKLLSILLDKYDNDLTLALAAYNAGGGAVDRAGGVPSEGVQRYVDKVLAIYAPSEG